MRRTILAVIAALVCLAVPAAAVAQHPHKIPLYKANEYVFYGGLNGVNQPGNNTTAYNKTKKAFVPCVKSCARFVKRHGSLHLKIPHGATLMYGSYQYATRTGITLGVMHLKKSTVIPLTFTQVLRGNTVTFTLAYASATVFDPHHDVPTGVMGCVSYCMK